MALYRRFWYKSLHNINFDNPVYRPSKCTEENVNMPDRETSLLPPTTDHPHHHQYHQSIGVIAGFPTALPSASSTTISFSSSGSSSAIDPNSATRTFTSTTLVQDATEVRYTLFFVEPSQIPTIHDPTTTVGQRYILLSTQRRPCWFFQFHSARRHTEIHSQSSANVR